MRKNIFKGFYDVRRRFIKGVELFALTSLFSMLVACQNSPAVPGQNNRNNSAERKQSDQNALTGQTQAADGFYRLMSDKPVKLNVTPREIIRTNKSQTFPKAAIEQYAGSRRKYINEELNSRSPIVLKSGDWKIKWQTDLPASFSPSAVLQAHDRIVLEGDGLWSLFDLNGKKLLHGQLGASGVVLDGENFYAADSTGLVFARRLTDGKDVFGLSLYFGDAYERTFMLRRNQRFLAVSTERELDPELDDTKENSLIELVDLGSPLKTDRDGLLQSARNLNHLARKTKLLLAAAHGETIVLATQNRIYTADMALNISKALSGDFTPLALSLDEQARVYLVVEQKNRRFLWIILPTGELNTEFELPSAFGREIKPPIIGYDHRIYLLAGNEILAVNELGQLIWKAMLGAESKGAVITAGQQLLVAAGNELLSFDEKGKKRILFNFSDQFLQTSPLLTDTGEILISSQKSLLNLAIGY